MKPSIRLRRALWSAVIFLALIGAAVAVRRMVHLVPIVVRGYHPPAVTSNPAAARFAALDDLFAHHPILTLVHIVPGLLFMMLGPFQFSSSRPLPPMAPLEWPHFCYLRCGDRIFGTGDELWHAGYRGGNQASATTRFATFFLFALCKAFRHIRRREVALHREWMIRAFAVGLAVATIRPIIGMFFATSRFSGLRPYEFFGIGFWIGFVLHLIAAEAWIHATLPRQTTAGFHE
jgi:Predicted membrane protein (DUF2306)